MVEGPTTFTPVSTQWREATSLPTGRATEDSRSGEETVEEMKSKLEDLSEGVSHFLPSECIDLTFPSSRASNPPLSLNPSEA